MFDADEIQRLIEAGIPGARAYVVDDAGDHEHFTAEVVSPTFETLSLVRQHQAVYACLGSRMGREIHALALKTYTPAQWKAAGKETS